TDPLFEKLQTILEELVERFRDNLEIFADVRERVEALVAEMDERVERESHAAAQRVEQMEILAIAKRSAAEVIKARLDAHTIPAPVSEFLVQQWLKLLLLLHVREGKDSAAWTGAIETMDRLIWSIQTKGTREERRDAIAVIPGLVKKLS